MSKSGVGNGGVTGRGRGIGSQKWLVCVDMQRGIVPIAVGDALKRDWMEAQEGAARSVNTRTANERNTGRQRGQVDMKNAHSESLVIPSLTSSEYPQIPC